MRLFRLSPSWLCKCRVSLLERSSPSRSFACRVSDPCSSALSTPMTRPWSWGFSLPIRFWLSCSHWPQTLRTGFWIHEFVTTEKRMEEISRRVAHRTLWSDAWRQFRRHRLAMAGLAIFGFFVVAFAAGPLIYRTPPDTINFAHANEGPGIDHPFGTNDRGEDILARILYGGRVSLAVGIVAMLIGVLLGTAIGAIAGYFGGIIDTILMRITELLISLPQLPLLLLVVYFFRD